MGALMLKNINLERDLQEANERVQRADRAHGDAVAQKDYVQTALIRAQRKIKEFEKRLLESQQQNAELRRNAPLKCGSCLEWVDRGDTRELACGCSVHVECFKAFLANKIASSATPTCYALKEVRKDGKTEYRPCGALIMASDVMCVDLDLGNRMVAAQGRKTKLLSNSVFCCASIGCDGLVSSQSAAPMESCGKCSAAHCMMCHRLGAEHAVAGFNPASCLAAKQRLLDGLDGELGNDLSNNTKACPFCLVAVVKEGTGDCNSMICDKCTCRFCWLCGVVTVTPDEALQLGSVGADSMGHAHFRKNPEQVYGVRPLGWYKAVNERQSPQCLLNLGASGECMLYWRAAAGGAAAGGAAQCAPWPTGPGKPALYTKPSRAQLEERMFGRRAQLQ